MRTQPASLFFVATLLWFPQLCVCSLELDHAAIPQSPQFDDISLFIESDISKIDAWLEQQTELCKYPSLSVAIIHDDQIVYQGAFGYENINSRIQAIPETSYHVASVTKVFTATLAVMLHEQGVIDLDQPVVNYLPENISISKTPNNGAKITLRQLASHTSGLPRGLNSPVQSIEGRYHLDQDLLYKNLETVQLDFDPGSDSSYSNLGFGLLGHALERAAGKPLNQLFDELIFNPLNLESATIHFNDNLRIATGYSEALPRRPEKHSYKKRMAASGGLIASAPDLARFMSSQWQPGFLSVEALQQLQTPTLLLDGVEADTALGWSVRSRITTGPILKKNGGRNNCSAWVGFSPEHRIGVAVVTNCGGPDVDPIGYWLLERSVPGGIQLVTQHGYAKVAPWTEVRWENDQPFVEIKNQWHTLLSIDGKPVAEVMAFARQQFGSKAQKRLAEDLVELLTKMGHQPKWEVTLDLENISGIRLQKCVRMTEDNRNQVRQ